MVKGYFIVLVWLLAVTPVWARPAARSLREAPLLPALETVRAVPLATQSAFNETVYFGGTAWAPDSMRWEALRDSVWTFETGVGSAIKEPGHTYPGVDPYKPDGFHATMEGWTGLDHTRDPNIVQYFRRLSAADPRWQAGAVAVGSPGGLGGNYSFWAGVFNEEAAALCYSRGQGYGNRWNICLAHSFPHPGGAGPVTLEYDYRNQTEDGFDYTTVRVEKNGTVSEVASYTGNLSGHASVALDELPNAPGTVTLTFCVTSDMSWSDEDGEFPTNVGAFALDNVSLSGGITYVTDFEADDGGWTVVPPGPGVGDWSRLVALDDLPAMDGGVQGTCTLDDSVLVLFDPGTSGHPELQDNVVVSPWIDLVRAGEVGRPGKQIQLNGYLDLPLANYVFLYTEAQWYPDSCTVPPRTSPWTWNHYAVWTGSPLCLGWTSNTQATYTNVIPRNAEQVRIAVGTLDWCAFYSGCAGMSNTTPWIDNIRFAVFDTNTLQAAIDAAAEGDTLLIPPGTYSGSGNRNLDFGGKNLVLVGTGGAEVTVIDCQHLGRGFLFQSGEDSTSVVDGFTVRNGQAPPDNYGDPMDGGGIWIGGGSHPGLRNCVIELSTAGSGGGLAVESGSGGRITGCTFDSNTAVGSEPGTGWGGGVWSGGELDLDQCVLRENLAAYGGGAFLNAGTVGNSTVTGNHATVLGGGLIATVVHDCEISDNVVSFEGGLGGGEAGGVSCRTITDCIVTRNSARTGGGVEASTVRRCTITGNTAVEEGGGLYLHGGVAEDCTISGNTAGTGGGIATTPGYFDSAVLRGLLVTGNEAAHGGGVAFVVDLTEEVRMDSSTVSGNHAALGGGVFVSGGKQLAAGGTILWGNGADSSGSEVWLDAESLGASFSCCALDSAGIGGATAVTYNGPQVFSNPLFCSPALWTAAPNAAGEYTLAAGSPCLPASNPCGVLIGARDQGCTTVGVGDDLDGPKPPVLAAYPNPFTGSLHVSFSAPEDAVGARVEIFDLQGRLTWSREVPAPVGDLEWDGRDASGRSAAPGVYFVQVRAGRVTKAVRVVRLR